MAEKETQKMGVILIRGLCKVDTTIKDAIFSLGLQRKNACVVRPMTPEYVGMAKKAKDYVTWGEIDEDTYKELVEKRGQKTADGKDKKFFRLNPPRGGFERGGIKKSFNNGGALGYRKAKINDLIRKML